MTKGPSQPLRLAQAILLAAMLGLSPSAAAAQPSNEFIIGHPPSANSTPRAEAPGFPGPGIVHDTDTIARGGHQNPEVKPGCLNNRQLRRGLRGHDFDNIEIGRKLGGDAIEVLANYGGSLYRMKLDRCSGRVSNVERVKRNSLGGVGLQFGY